MIRLAFYGDDFSGSSDVLEVLARAGVRTRLYLDPPGAVEPGLEAVGVAGVSRSLPTGQLDGVLRPALQALRKLGPKQVHYKVCSTFDSSAAVGSIGRAIDVGADVFGADRVPVVVGAPHLGRYVAFGNLFARSGQDRPVDRLDRHPTMSRHPVTPMREADLRLVLAEQTNRPVELIDAPTLDRWRTGGGGELPGKVVLFDTMSEDHLASIGEAVWRLGESDRSAFAVGSSGLHAALVAHWRAKGELPDRPTFGAGPVDRIVAVCGSCSPVTARQIDWAAANGFHEVPLDPAGWLAGGDSASVAAEVLEKLAVGSVIVHAARGPDDPRVRAAADTGPRLGRFLANVLARVLADGRVRRVAVAGGDTSGYVARGLGIQAFEMAAPIAPGSPLCRMIAPGSAADGREVIFKGGQVGKADFFGLVRAGQEQT